MSVPSNRQRQYWDVAVSLDNGTTFQTICGLTTRETSPSSTTPATRIIRDCADPTAGAVPRRERDRAAVRYLRDRPLQPRAGRSHPPLGGQSLVYRFIMGEDASDAVDAGYYQGNFVLTNKQLGGGRRRERHGAVHLGIGWCVTGRWRGSSCSIR
jgi:hypothetical protein